ncbi:hypothetical protein T07_14375 [Trichinella nelsoni]|uniref:Uncharacterized protein n=1 Tax=Trichinella nelsoni TaxID=6336 RepID=A0A0V0RWT4_9BILA|nr:hypothetical protein T07_14375 [Trichinella nelsoni]
MVSIKSGLPMLATLYAFFTGIRVIIVNYHRRLAHEMYRLPFRIPYIKPFPVERMQTSEIMGETNGTACSNTYDLLEHAEFAGY